MKAGRVQPHRHGVGPRIGAADDDAACSRRPCLPEEHHARVFGMLEGHRAFADVHELERGVGGHRVDLRRSHRENRAALQQDPQCRIRRRIRVDTHERGEQPTELRQHQAAGFRNRGRRTSDICPVEVVSYAGQAVGRVGPAWEADTDVAVLGGGELRAARRPVPGQHQPQGSGFVRAVRQRPSLKLRRQPQARWGGLALVTSNGRPRCSSNKPRSASCMLFITGRGNSDYTDRRVHGLESGVSVHLAFTGEEGSAAFIIISVPTHGCKCTTREPGKRLESVTREAHDIFELYLPLQLRADLVIGQWDRASTDASRQSGHSHYITGTADIRRLHRLRALVDAVSSAAAQWQRIIPVSRFGSSRGITRTGRARPRGRLDPDRHVFSDGAARTLVVHRAPRVSIGRR